MCTNSLRGLLRLAEVMAILVGGTFSFVPAAVFSSIARGPGTYVTLCPFVEIKVLHSPEI